MAGNCEGIFGGGVGFFRYINEKYIVLYTYGASPSILQVQKNHSVPNGVIFIIYFWF